MPTRIFASFAAPAKPGVRPFVRRSKMDFRWTPFLSEHCRASLDPDVRLPEHFGHVFDPISRTPSVPPVFSVSHPPYHLFVGRCDCFHLHQRRALLLFVRSSGRHGAPVEAAGLYAAFANRSAQSDSLVHRRQHPVPHPIFGSFFCRWQQPELLDRRLSYPTWKCPSDCSYDIISNPRMAFGDLSAGWAQKNSIELSPAIRKEKSLKEAHGVFSDPETKKGQPIGHPTAC